MIKIVTTSFFVEGHLKHLTDDPMTHSAIQKKVDKLANKYKTTEIRVIQNGRDYSYF